MLLWYSWIPLFTMSLVLPDSPSSGNLTSRKVISCHSSAYWTARDKGPSPVNCLVLLGYSQCIPGMRQAIGHPVKSPQTRSLQMEKHSKEKRSNMREENTAGRLSSRPRAREQFLKLTRVIREWRGNGPLETVWLGNNQLTSPSAKESFKQILTFVLTIN